MTPMVKANPQKSPATMPTAAYQREKKPMRKRQAIIAPLANGSGCPWRILSTLEPNRVATRIKPAVKADRITIPLAKAGLVCHGSTAPMPLSKSGRARKIGLASGETHLKIARIRPRKAKKTLIKTRKKRALFMF